jgi:hypothetical protein
MKSIFLYLVLVGLPVLGTVGLLQMGQSLAAPVSVAGTWSAQLTLPSSSDSADRDPLLRSDPTIFTILQSGPSVFLTFDDAQRTKLAGSVDQVTISATFLSREDQGNRNGAERGSTYISFRAAANRQTEPDRLIGILVFGDGSKRAEVPFIAMRKSEVRKATGNR